MGIEDKKEEVSTEVKKSEVNEDIVSLFSGEELSEEFKTQAKAIFEAAIQVKIEEKTRELEEQFNTQLEEQSKEFAESLVGKIDEYLEYVVETWMKENELAVEQSIRTEVAEDFMVGLKNLFMEHYIDIPEEKVEVVEGLSAKVDELQEELNSAISERAELVDQLNAYKKEIIASEISEGLSEVQSEKLKALSEHIEFVSENDYKQKLLLTRKKYFESKDNEDSVVTSLDSEETLDESYSPSMSRYVQNIARTVKK